jgi:hypothetical protein
MKYWKVEIDKPRPHKTIKPPKAHKSCEKCRRDMSGHQAGASYPTDVFRDGRIVRKMLCAQCSKVYTFDKTGKIVKR